MRGSKQDLPVAVEMPGITIRVADWGEMTTALENFPAGLDTAPLFKGLPDDRCQCPHWGYVIKGKVTFKFPDREETYEAGDAYYVPPGHTPVHYAGGEVVEFSPTEGLRETIGVVIENLKAAGAAR